MKPNQRKIYYLSGPSKEVIEKSPYFEPFLGADIPVLMLTHQGDEVIFAQMQTHKDFILQNIESSFDEIEKDLLKANKNK